MSFIKKNWWFLTFFTLLTAYTLYSEYSDYKYTHLLSLNGKITGIRKTIKEEMYITVSGKEYLLEHHWPQFQKQVEISDSVYKASRDTNLILIKTKTHQRIVCNLH
ncbi:MAG TPA: hypothetical protein VIM89_09090 [Mucilaginibacter sp.]